MTIRPIIERVVIGWVILLWSLVHAAKEYREASRNNIWFQVLDWLISMLISLFAWVMFWILAHAYVATSTEVVSLFAWIGTIMWLKWLAWLWEAILWIAVNAFWLQPKKDNEK